MNYLLLMMGGSGSRLGGNIPKQYREIDGKPLFWYIASEYSKLQEISHICIVSHTDWLGYVKTETKDISSRCSLVLVEGGKTRSESILNGLKAIKDFASNEDVVLIHDSTHPYVDLNGTYEVIEAVKKYGGATLAACQYDTCYQMDASCRLKRVIPRQEFVSGASPEAFRFGDISRIYFESTEEELNQMTSAGAIALAHNIPMKVILTKTLNLKITYPEDLELFRLLVHTYFFKNEGSLENEESITRYFGKT